MSMSSIGYLYNASLMNLTKADYSRLYEKDNGQNNMDIVDEGSDDEYDRPGSVHALTHSLTHSRTHLLTHLLTHSLTHLLTYS